MINKGRWNSEEKILYYKYFKIYGKNWKLISYRIPTRTQQQIRTHHQKTVQKNIKFALILLELSKK